MERTSCGYTDNIKSERFNEARMFSMRQLRNTFFAMLHQCTTKMIIDDSSDKVAVLQKDVIKLEETDKVLDSKMREMNNRLSKEINENKEEFITAQRSNEKTLS